MSLPPLRRIVAPAAVMAITGSLLMATPAHAAPDPLDAVRTVSDAASDPAAAVLDATAALVDGDSASVAASASAAGVETLFPADAASDITLATSPDDGSASVAVSISLPVTGAEAEVADGTAVSYSSDGVDVVTTAKETGAVQIATVLDGPDAPTAYDYVYDLPEGAALEADGAGGALIVDDYGIPLGHVAAPWAYDSTGAAIPTHYEILGSTLRQVVEHRTAGVSYPVVADPTTTLFPWGIRVNFSKAETKSIANSPAPNAAAAFCRFFRATVPGIVCAALSLVVVNRWLTVFKNAANRGRCAEIHVPHLTGPVLWSAHLASACRA